jgi:hypothetical protein
MPYFANYRLLAEISTPFVNNRYGHISCFVLINREYFHIILLFKMFIYSVCLLGSSQVFVVKNIVWLTKSFDNFYTWIEIDNDFETVFLVNVRCIIISFASKVWGWGVYYTAMSPCPSLILYVTSYIFLCNEISYINTLLILNQKVQRTSSEFLYIAWNSFLMIGFLQTCAKNFKLV